MILPNALQTKHVRQPRWQSGGRRCRCALPCTPLPALTSVAKAAAGWPTSILLCTLHLHLLPCGIGSGLLRTPWPTGVAYIQTELYDGTSRCYGCRPDLQGPDFVMPKMEDRVTFVLTKSNFATDVQIVASSHKHDPAHDHGPLPSPQECQQPSVSLDPEDPEYDPWAAEATVRPLPPHLTPDLSAAQASAPRRMAQQSVRQTRRSGPATQPRDMEDPERDLVADGGAACPPWVWADQSADAPNPLLPVEGRQSPTAPGGDC